MNPDVEKHHEQLDWLRTSFPVYYDAPSRSFFLTRYADVRAYLTQPHWKDPGRAEPGTFLEKAGKPKNPERPEDDGSIGYLDNPKHERIRHPLATALYGRVAKSRPLVERVVAEKLDELASKRTFDVVTEYAMHVPLKTLALLIGVDEKDLPQFRKWAEACLKIFQTTRTVRENFAMNAANEAFSSYLDAAMADRRLRPREDLISDLVQAQAEGAAISDSEIRVNCISLVVAAIMTTSDLIGSAIWLFLTNPAELAKLEADPSLIRAAVEEALRLEPPIESEWRVASQDIEIGGCPIRRGQVVSGSLNAANRDPSVFPDPHKFDITREMHPHMSFGSGPHICLGAPLGRLEGQVAILRFFERFPSVHLAQPDALPRWRRLAFFRGLSELVVET
ncbi:MAG: cytochrome P450 [Alphaproteobacteria bacterium]|nr:cytochrome P450 [Alphaproteobacteria bacterium]